MANKVKAMSSIKDFLIKLKAVDELPEELAEDALQMTEEVKDALEEEEEVKVEDEEEVEVAEEESKDESPVPNEKAMEDAMTKVLMKYGLIKDSAMKSLDELEEECEITKDEDGEESVTVDPEVINNDSARRELIREIKPVIASIKDSKQRKKISDAFAKAIRLTTSTTTDYATIEKIKKSNVSDSKPATDDTYGLGMEWAKKFNPHYKED